ncbi:unnamed protein product, partial [Musa acuminata subsp. burmannicoides]
MACRNFWVLTGVTKHFRMDQSAGNRCWLNYQSRCYTSNTGSAANKLMDIYGVYMRKAG